MEAKHWWINASLNKDIINKFEHIKNLLDKIIYAAEIIANNHGLILEIDYNYIETDSQVLIIFKNINMSALRDINFLVEEINDVLDCCEIVCDANDANNAYLTYYIQTQDEYNEFEKRMHRQNLNEGLSALQLKPIDDIEFTELYDISDDEGVIFMDVIFGDTLDSVIQTIPEVDAFFKQVGLINNDVNVVGLHKILGDINNDNRNNWLIEFDKSTIVSPIVRLRMGNDIKWISDFVINYAKKYK